MKFARLKIFFSVSPPININVKYHYHIRKISRYWLPVVMMLSVMFYFSSDKFSVEHTQSAVEKVLGWLMPVARESTLSLINHMLRKLAHFVEYMLLAGLLFRAFRADSALRWRAAWAVYSGLIIIAWAVADELHQAFSQVRHASMQDALLDVTGGLLMLVLIALYQRQLLKVEV